MQRNQGFTIIELMAVVSILSILAVLALSAYTDYTIRAKVTEGLGLAAEAKTSVSEYFYNVGRMPTSNSQAGLVEAGTYEQFQFIENLEIRTAPSAGIIAITFSIPSSNADGKELWLVPRTEDRLIYWDCYPPDRNGIERSQAPPNCRG